MADEERQGLEEEQEEFEGWELEDDTESSSESEGEEEGEEQAAGGQSPQQPEPFKFSDEEAAGAAGGQSPGGEGQSADDYIEIVHRGEKKFVHKDKAKELIQKGYDYDVKVGPHSRLVQLIQQDPGAAQMLDQYFRQKMSGQQPQQGQQAPQGQQQAPQDPFNGYDDDDVITAADARKALQQQQQAIQQAIQAQQQQAQQQQQQRGQQAGMTQVQMMLQSRDPQNFAKVAPRLQEYAARYLPKEKYDRVNSDPAALCEFYDWVASQVVGSQQQQSASGGKRSAPASFRAQSGGGQPPRGKDQGQKIWEMPRKDFEAQMAKIKGY